MRKLELSLAAKRWLALANRMPHSTAITMLSIAAVLLLTLPWLNPFSLGPTPAVPTLLFAWVCAAVFLLGCALVGTCRAYRLVWIVAASWLLAALISALIGLLQYFGKTGGLEIWVNSTSVGEAFGNLRQRNHYATLTNIGQAALVFCSIRVGSSVARGAGSMRYAVLGAVLAMGAVLLAAGNAASSSRTGLMQLVLLVALTGYWHVRTGKPGKAEAALVRTVLVSAVLGYVLAAAFLPLLASLDPDAIGILARLHENSPACASRLTLWSNVLHLIAQKPWFGWGWGELGYAHFITLYPGARFCDILDNAHDLPLHLAVELGVPFALAFCTACAWLVWRAKPWRETNPTRQLAWTVLASIALHSLLEYPLWYGPFQMAAGLSIWLLCVTPIGFDGRQAHAWADASVGQALPWPLSGVAAAIGVAALALCAYTGWDYWRISQIYLAPSERSPAYQGDTLEKIRASWLFENQVRFAELGITALTAQNAEHIFGLAKDLLHFSAEPQVAQRIVESAVLLGRDADAQYYLQRFKSAFPKAHAQWSNALPPAAGP